MKQWQLNLPAKIPLSDPCKGLGLAAELDNSVRIVLYTCRLLLLPFAVQRSVLRFAFDLAFESLGDIQILDGSEPMHDF